MHPDHLYNNRRQNCTRAALIIKNLTSKTVSHRILRSIATTTTLPGSRLGQSEIKLYLSRSRDRPNHERCAAVRKWFPLRKQCWQPNGIYDANILTDRFHRWLCSVLRSFILGFKFTRFHLNEVRRVFVRTFLWRTVDTNIDSRGFRM